MKDYMTNLYHTLRVSNNSAFRHAIAEGSQNAAKAWDNKKRQTHERHAPRGRAFKRVEQLYRDSQFRKADDLLMEMRTKLMAGKVPK